VAGALCRTDRCQGGARIALALYTKAVSEAREHAEGRPDPRLEAAECARRRAFLALPMSERLRRGVEFSNFALRNVGVARRPKP
jgi:hypothetical protein